MFKNKTVQLVHAFIHILCKRMHIHTQTLTHTHTYTHTHTHTHTHVVCDIYRYLHTCTYASIIYYMCV